MCCLQGILKIVNGKGLNMAAALLSMQVGWVLRQAGLGQAAAPAGAHERVWDDQLGSQNPQVSARTGGSDVRLS